MIITAISDTHLNHHNLQLPDGDILIHTGDATAIGFYSKTKEFLEWMAKQPYTYKIFVPGNHDWSFDCNDAYNKFHHCNTYPQDIDKDRIKLLEFAANNNIHILINQTVEIEGLKIFGSAETPEFYNWAFNRTEEQLAQTYSAIPTDIDILPTHGPPKGILDISEGESLGSTSLSEAITNLKQLKLHIFGHIHPSYGYKESNGVHYINASICNNYNKPVNKPLTFKLDKFSVEFI